MTTQAAPAPTFMDKPHLSAANATVLWTITGTVLPTGQKENAISSAEFFRQYRLAMAFSRG